MQKGSERIQVAVRARPIAEKEINKGYKKCVNVDIDRGEILVKNPSEPNEIPRTFYFDKTYDERITQERIFNETSLPIIESVVQGYNGTIFAYGQTGTGKTFTMEGEIKSPEKMGIIPRSFEMIFNLIKTTYNTNYLIRVSYLEIYNEEIRDLLAKGKKQKLDIKEDPETGFYVKDLSTFVVKTPQEMIELMERGRDLKVVAGHDMNARSSRSHCIFSIIVDNSTKDEDGTEHIRMGKLNLVDLAGSERQSKTGATGELLEQAININLSLTILGKVIFALVADKKQHVPYRESKLTKLLADSLGGNSKTVMIANVGPADFNYDETVTTLRYASRAKMIKNAPKINEDPKDAMIRQYQDELNKLKQELAMAAGGVYVEVGGVMKENKILSAESKKKMEEMEDKIKKEKEDILKNLEKEKKQIEESKITAEDEKLKLLEKLKEKEDEQAKANKKKEKLLAKLKALEQNLVIGEENEKKAKQNEEILKKTKEELEEREKNRLILQKELERQTEEKLNFNAKFGDQQSEIKEKESIYQKLHEKLQELENEKNDINKEFERSYNEYNEYKKELVKQINYKDLIINHCIPKKYQELIESLMEYDGNTNEWFIPHLDDNLEKEEIIPHNLAMGFHDDEELFNPHLIGNDIKLSMMLDMNNQKSVYFTYEDKPKKKSTAVNTKRPGTGKNFNI